MNCWLPMSSRQKSLTAWRGPSDGASLFPRMGLLSWPTPRLFPSLPDLLPAAFAIASRTRVGVYDCRYVALAEREQCQLVTADDKLVRSLQAG